MQLLKKNAATSEEIPARLVTFGWTMDDQWSFHSITAYKMATIFEVAADAYFSNQRQRKVFTATSGLLRLKIPGKITREIAYPKWSMTADYVRLQGWILKFHISDAAKTETINFGFYSRHSRPKGHLVSVVNKINRSFAQKLGQFPEFAPMQK